MSFALKVSNVHNNNQQEEEDAELQKRKVIGLKIKGEVKIPLV